MRYFGIPTCPYCKKRVNLIRTWSLKRQGEYQCPRCGGISNIFLSPLLYVVALLALFSSGAIYFFHKFVLDDVDIRTALYVFLPFAGFFFLSIFFVYLAKPIIKKVSREDMKKKKDRGRKGDQSAAEPVGVYYDDREYPPVKEEPRRDYRTGPVQQERPLAERLQGEAVQPLSRRAGVQQVQPQVRRPQPAPPQTIAAPAPSVQRPAAAQQRPATVQNIRPPMPVTRQRPAAPVQQVVPAPRQTGRVIGSTQAPAVADDFFAKYDDPEYIQRRLREMKGENR